MRLPTPRILFLLAFAGCLVLIGSALYMEHGMDMEPCPLCIFQRVAVIAAGLCCLIGLLLGGSRLGARLSAVLVALAALAGIGLAGRHVWLQHLPADQVPQCGPGLDYLLDVFPWQDVVSKVLRGSGECAEVSWTFLYLSIPEWTLIVFIGLFAWAALIWVAAGRSHPN